MADKIASLVLHLCVAADLFVSIVYFAERRHWAGLYWLAAATISYAALKGLK